MTVPHPPAPRGPSPRRFVGAVALAAALVATISLAPSPHRVTAADPPPAQPKETLVGGLPLFAGWPANRKPDAVIVFTGQTYGYLQPCGCSRPQTGGLERRAEFINSLKAKGWPVAAVDLGDLYPEKVALGEQGRLKYIATMNALREMGYLGVGIGRTELQGDLFALLGSYAFQKEQRPFSLAGNAVGVIGNKVSSREEYFSAQKKNARPVVELAEVGTVGEVPVGVTGVVGKALQQDNVKQKWDATLDFPDAKQAIADAVKGLNGHALKPQLQVLVFQGPVADALKVAADFPQFQAILCQTEEGFPAPLKPQIVVGQKGEKTLVVQVGHKGQQVGVLGAFKKPGGFDFEYQLVPLGEEYVTPPAAVGQNKALLALENYAKDVKAANLLPKYPRTAHFAQIKAAPVKLTYVGTQACAACHVAEFNVWNGTHHGHAMKTLVNAQRPSLRQFDGECVKCHTVGFDHHDGYVDDKKTPFLRDVGCESCHGPGSGHVAQPKNKNFLAWMSPWKQQPGEKLPNAEQMKLIADTPASERGKIKVEPAQQVLNNRVEGMCMKCHDNEADPHFDLFKNWPKVTHSGLAPVGGWPVVPPKVAIPNPAPPNLVPQK